MTWRAVSAFPYLEFADVGGGATRVSQRPVVRVCISFLYFFITTSGKKELCAKWYIFELWCIPHTLLPRQTISGYAYKVLYSAMIEL